MRFEIVVAHNKERGIGLDGKIPWSCPEDMKFFRDLTTGHGKAIVMGSNTWKSLGSKPLPGRINAVISSNLDKVPNGVMLFRSVKESILGMLKTKMDTVYVIGGESIYKQFLVDHPSIVSKIHSNEITYDNTTCDTFFAQVPDAFEMTSCKFTPDVVYYIFENPKALENKEERQYLDLIRDIMENGTYTMDRTGTGTLSTFGNTMRFSLKDGRIPLLTSKKVFLRGIVEELLWMISGSTDANILSDKGVKIWDGNSSREFLDDQGFINREVGDIGPGYGFQMRHSGAKYVDCETDYSGQGVDQLQQCIYLIKNDPSSRRILMNLWNPIDISEMNLPPCHMMCQFNVADGKLSCQMYQRSCDMGLGVPFNIAFYSLLTHMIAQICDLEAGEFIHAMGNTHIYCNHVDALKEQVQREPLAFPKVVLHPSVNDIDRFTAEDIVLEDYYYYPGIKMEFSA